MINGLIQLWRLICRKVEHYHDELQSSQDRRAAVNAFTLCGAGMGVLTIWSQYGILFLAAWLWPRKQDPILVIMFLYAWFLIGAAQGVWLGGVTGRAWALRLQKRVQAAGLLCALHGLSFLALLGAFLARCPSEERLLLLIVLSGGSTVWAILLLLAGCVFLRRK